MLTASNDIFNSIKALRPKRHAFNLSYRKKFDCDMGQLIPICCEEVVSGDKFKVGNECVVRMQPLVAPILDSIKVKTEYFYVPFRILWDDFEDFFTGGEDGNYSTRVPVWNQSPNDHSGMIFLPCFINVKGSLGDYFGLPVTSSDGIYLDLDSLYPNGFAQYAYNMIWNEYYRDENIDEEVELNSNIILYRRWKKDYFTSALPFQQRGMAPTLPINIGLKSDFSYIPVESFPSSTPSTMPTPQYPVYMSKTSEPAFYTGTSLSNTGKNFLYLDSKVSVSAIAQHLTASSSVSSSDVINVADLRLMFQVQKWMERQARGGARH